MTIDPKRPHDNDATRCTTKVVAPDGQLVTCSDAGAWTLDRKRKTWRPSLPSDRARRCWAHGPGAETHPHGPRVRRPKPNARVQRMAGLMLGIAPEITQALAEVDDELSLLGFPSSSSRGVSYTATDDDDDPVGNDASRIHELTSWREDLRDTIDDLGNRVDVLIRCVRRIRNIRWALGVKLCSENQQDRQGSIEWGDPTCTELPTVRGLCSRCYHAERRWRADHDLVGLEEPAA